MLLLSSITFSQQFSGQVLDSITKQPIPFASVYVVELHTEAATNANGNFILAKKFGGVQDDFGNGLCIDANGSIYITGSYSGTANFGSSNLVCQGTQNVFVYWNVV